MVYFLLLFTIPVILFILYFHLQYDLFIIEKFHNNENKNDDNDYDVDQKKQVQDQLERYYSYIYPLNEKITNYRCFLSYNF